MLAFMYLCLTLSFAVRSTAKHINNLAMETGDTLHKVNTEIDELHRATLEVGLTAREARKASIKEVAMLNMWNASVSTTLANLNSTLLSVQRTSDVSAQNLSLLATNTSATIQGFQPVLSSANSELVAMQAATKDLDGLVNDPNLAKTLANVSSTTKHLDATSSDVKDWVHDKLHPSWATKAWGIMLDIGSALNPFHL